MSHLNSKSSKHCSPTAVNKETPASFLSLPSELRNDIYRLVLLHQEPICFLAKRDWPYTDQQQQHTPGIFRANRTICHEASTFFYAENCFDFITCNAGEGASFLKQIGRNASYIQHIYMNFPKFHYLDVGDVTLEDQSVSLLANLQSSCANLSTLTTSLGSTSAMEQRLDSLEHSKIVTEALKLVDTKFKAIPSLPEIIVEVYEDGPSGYIRMRMANHGWTIRTIMEEEEEEEDLSDDLWVSW